jgi:hypothetical protein
VSDLVLVPQKFRCREHDEDLTELVRQRAAFRLQVASLNFRNRRRLAPQPFRVQVTCPKGGGHDLQFAGSAQ